MKRWNINARVLLVALVPALLIALLLSFYFTRTRVADLERALAERGSIIARQLSIAAEFGLYTGNRDVLNQLTLSVMRDRDVTAIAIRDHAGVLLARSGTAPISEMPHDVDARKPMQVTADDGRSLVSSAPVWQSSAALEEFFDAPPGADAGNARLLGRVYVTLSRAPLMAERRRLVFDAVTIALLILAANVYLAVRMSRNVTRPVVKLTHAVQRLARGDLSTRVAPDSDGVIRELEHGVNTMAAALESARVDLEQRVTDATAQLAQKKDEAERANLAKTRFLAAASHDLRQPLHALGLFVTSLADRPLPEDARGTVTHIEKSVYAMQDLIDALLDISRLDAGAVQPRLSAFPVYRLLSTLAANYAAQAESKGVVFRTVPSSAVVYSDPILLERIMLNLVSNAVRYTPTGKILLGCRRHGGGLRLEVWDTGIGIDADQQRRIFEEFYRVGSAPDADRGQGLGLAIVDRLARLLGHEIIVRSRPGAGSMFALQVPLAAGPVFEATPAVPAHERVTLAGLSVLVIDDDLAALHATRSLLEGWGCRVATASSGIEAESRLQTLGDRPPELYICDYRLGQSETGVDVLDRLRRRLARDVRAVIVTADTSLEVRRAVEAGGYALLYKPLRPAKLRALTHHLLTQASGQKP